MLRNEKQVALHDLLEALTTAARRYADDTDALEGDDPLAQRCRELALRREQLAAAVAAEMQRHGDLPTEPDTDRDTLSRLGSRLRAMLSGDEREAMIRERLGGEAELARLAQQASQLATEPGWRDLLEAVRREAEQAQLELQKLAAA
jgi:hypothetical protein